MNTFKTKRAAMKRAGRLLAQRDAQQFVLITADGFEVCGLPPRYGDRFFGPIRVANAEALYPVAHAEYLRTLDPPKGS